MNDNMIAKIDNLVEKLNRAAESYYMGADEILSNYEYDRLYDELVKLQEEAHYVPSNSPTQKVGYEVMSNLPKERHSFRMLSLDKTKDVQALRGWLKDQEGILSWKLDGLTIVLTYEKGLLVKAVTRGNGVIGEVVTNNARVFKNIPSKIPYRGTLIIRGEAVIRYSDFKKLNMSLAEDEQYKNPRNLCSGSVRQLNNEITAKRNVLFFPFQLVYAEEVDFEDLKTKELDWLKTLGFQVVDYKLVSEENIEQAIKAFSEEISQNDFPSDGLVLTYNNISYSQGLGQTAKFPKDSIAFKWKDEIKDTKLLEVEWSASRTGLINPIAIFKPVDLEGTTVSRASVHNLSIFKELSLGLGDVITVYKANMIIPQIADNLTRSANLKIPERCPICNEKTEIRKNNQAEVLYCSNPECAAKKIKSYAHFVSRDGMNIEGLSEATLEKLVRQGLMKRVGDLYRLENHKDVLVSMEGFGEKSFKNLIAAIEKSRNIHLENFIYALGITNVGLSNAKALCKSMDYDFTQIRKADSLMIAGIEGFGEIIASSVVDFFQEPKNQDMIDDLMQYITFLKEDTDGEKQILAGKVFVITGTVDQYKNRNELKSLIEKLGGKVTGSVTSKTDYLINNDIQSSSSKNKAAAELQVPILNEDAFNQLIKGDQL